MIPSTVKMQSPFLFVLLGLAVLIAVNPAYGKLEVGLDTFFSPELNRGRNLISPPHAAANCTDYTDCGDCTVQAGVRGYPPIHLHQTAHA